RRKSHGRAGSARIDTWPRSRPTRPGGTGSRASGSSSWPGRRREWKLGSGYIESLMPARK
ncbi:MAG: hypothetical protein ACLQGT_08940, partial [Terracidiphilus sp.]